MRCWLLHLSYSAGLHNSMNLEIGACAVPIDDDHVMTMEFRVHGIFARVTRVPCVTNNILLDRNNWDDQFDQ